MRLTHIKLSGFKSFVDPTVIPTPSDLVGVVGPNGCGKSNIIDAVRWVLGESRASELRGSSMQDVIFNGSGDRKPAARASVELIFDNSLGRAAGQWSSYAEISVRRVLTRDGSSSYFINNQQVRRRDVYDIFLGTGLGSRGYAIIGQGMINRLIEARPEEMRVYLEEAAGVSRYKERRRETENRLQDTFENLTRLEDIIRELNSQLEKLHNQAAVAKKYQDLQAEGELKQNALWLLREQAAVRSQKKLADEYADEQTKLEQQLAELRAIQAELEKHRSRNYDFNQALHNAQGALFEASAKVSRYEAEIKHTEDARQRLQTRRNQLQVQLQQWQDQQAHAQTAMADLSMELEQASEQAATLEEIAQSAQHGLPGMDAELRELSQQREILRQELARNEQKQALAEQTIKDTEKQLQAARDRNLKLADEQTRINAPDTAKLDDLQAEYEIAQARTQESQDVLIGLESDLAKHNQLLNNSLTAQQEQQQKLSGLLAKRQALQQLQERIQAKGSLQAWLQQQGLVDLKPLWQEITVDSHWTTALEAVLRERMQAIGITDVANLKQYASAIPPEKIAMYLAKGATAGAQYQGDSAVQESALINYVKTANHDLYEVLQCWLQNIYVAKDIDQALTMADLGLVVVPEGHIIDSHSIRFYAADDEQSGILARQQQINDLGLAIKAASLLADQCEREYGEAQARKNDLENRLQQQRQQTGTYLRHEHELQLHLNQARQQFNSASLQYERLARDIDELQQSQAVLQEQAGQAQIDFKHYLESVASLQNRVVALDEQIQSLAEKIERARQNSYEQEKQAQDARFNVRSLNSRLAELERNAKLASEQIANSDTELENLQGDLFELDESAIKQSLDEALAEKLQAEEQLRAARLAQEQGESDLRTIDQKRLQIEQKLEPQRAKITDLQLKEQASRLTIEQYAEQLDEREVDRSLIQSHIDREQWQNIGWLQSEVQSINRKISALGAVNLAALDELGKAQDRKQFLDAQQTDLQAAIDTLEAAIRKIDKETRLLLKQTFDQVNQHFSELFPRLFGGGKASLIMTGDEVLDAGVQVMAQPPGKRNSTINLLSGGEKALTAIALVFAFFKLNPAPFCLLDEVDAPLDDANTERYANLVRSMSNQTQFLFISHNKIAMQMAKQLIGVTMQEQGVSRIVAVDMDAALQLALPAA